MTPRQILHKMIDKLPETELHTVQRFVEFVQAHQDDPVLDGFRRAEATGTEPATPNELAALKAAEEDHRHGRVIAFEEAERRLMNKYRRHAARPKKAAVPARASKKKASAR